MQSILVEVAFRTNEHMLEKATEMFSKLNAIIKLHAPSGFVERLDVSQAVGTKTIAAEECRHVAGGEENEISED